MNRIQENTVLGIKYTTNILYNEQIGWHGNRVHYLHQDNDGSFRLIDCDISSKEMTVTEWRSEIMTLSRFNYDNTTPKCVKDLNNDGYRWEGSLLNGLPFGYGCIYGSDNELMYCGFVFEGKKVCYGMEYYPSINIIQYCGSFVNGLRYGFGFLYDMNGNEVYSGEWAYGNNKLYELCIYKNNGLCFDFSVNSVRIDTLKDITRLIVIKLSYLKKLEIGNDSFPSTICCQIKDCDALEEIVIKESCFMLSQSLVLSSRFIIF